MLAQNPNSRRPFWRMAIWLLALVFVALTVWWVRPVPEPVETPYEASMAIPSEWLEQARVTSPDGKADAVVVTAEPCVALQRPAGDDGGPGEITPVEGKQNPEASRVLSVRLVPKGERVEKEPPYPFPTRLFLDGVVAKSIFVSGPAPELKLGWKNDETLWIKVNREDAIHRAAEGVLERDGVERRVAVEYPL